MTFEVLALASGLLLIFMGLSGSVLRRLPLSTSIVYLAAGVVLGPAAFKVLSVDLLERAQLVERITEVVVLIALFTAGLKLRAPVGDTLWAIPIRLAIGSMILTVGMTAVIGYYLLDLSLGAAILLGAVLAPTDPVLASDVQVNDPRDQDRLRFGLTGEAGLNDGAAFPFVMLGLGLLDLHDVGPAGLRWWTIDLTWSVGAGIAIGTALGTAITKLTTYLRQHHREAVGLDEFLGLGTVAVAYGLALLLGAYGFLAVFAAGLAMRGVERRDTGEDADPVELASDPGVGEASAEVQADTASAYLVHSVLGFNQQIERVAEVAAVVLLGALFVGSVYLPIEALWFVPLLFLVVRPLSVCGALLGSAASKSERALMAWFGVRGIGSLYYLSFALHSGFAGDAAVLITGLVLVSVATSIVVHGITVTPLMERYHRRNASR